MNAEELKDLMEKWALTQRETARLFKVNDAAISCLLNGKYKRVPPYLQQSFLFFGMIPKNKQSLLIFEARKKEKKQNAC